MMSLTFVAESCLVLSKPLEPHALADDVEELVEGGPALLVVVHLLLGLLAGPAVHHPHLVGLLVALLVQPHQLLLAGPGLDAQVEAGKREVVSFYTERERG